MLELRLDAHGAGDGKSSLTSSVIVDEPAGTLALDGYAAAPVLLQFGASARPGDCPTDARTNSWRALWSWFVKVCAMRRITLSCLLLLYATTTAMRHLNRLGARRLSTRSRSPRAQSRGEWPSGPDGGGDAPCAATGTRFAPRSRARRTSTRRRSTAARRCIGRWSSDDLDMADMLLRAGARVTARTREGVTPLQLAATNGNAADDRSAAEGRAPS